MRSHGKKTPAGEVGIWIISGENTTEEKLPGIDPDTLIGPVKTYRISEIGRYLFSPKPVRVLKPLVGCEIYPQQPRISRIRERLLRFLPRPIRPRLTGSRVEPEKLYASRKRKQQNLQDPNLERHFKQIENLLRPYDAVLKRLLSLDPERVSDVSGICEDSDGKRTTLTLQGSVEGKITYLIENLSKDVGMILNTAQISDGLFEMSGFDFKKYDPHKSSRLLKLNQSGTFKCGIENSDGGIDGWIENTKLIDYLQLLEQSIRSNQKFRDSFHQCINGDAAPLKIFFNPQFEIEYSTFRPPETFKQVFKAYPMEITSKNVVINSLRKFQLGISFSYMVKSDREGDKLCTNISVMHDIRALDPIKDIIPQVYAEIDKRTCVSEAGRFYLLDAIKGFPNEK